LATRLADAPQARVCPIERRYLCSITVWHPWAMAVCE
jgi:hypothetical protein